MSRRQLTRRMGIIASWSLIGLVGLLVLAAGVALGFGIWQALDWLADGLLGVLAP